MYKQTTKSKTGIGPWLQKEQSRGLNGILNSAQTTYANMLKSLLEALRAPLFWQGLYSKLLYTTKELLKTQNKKEA